MIELIHFADDDDWWKNIKFNNYVKKNKMSFYVFFLTDQNTISKFLNNIASKQTFHTTTTHLHNSSSLQYIHLYNIKLNKQTVFTFTLFLS